MTFFHKYRLLKQTQLMHKLDLDFKFTNMKHIFASNSAHCKQLSRERLMQNLFPILVQPVFVQKTVQRV